MWTKVINWKPSLLKLFPLAVQNSPFLLKINTDDNFTPDMAFSNLFVREEDQRHVTATPHLQHGVPLITASFGHISKLRSILRKAQVPLFGDHS